MRSRPSPSSLAAASLAIALSSSAMPARADDGPWLFSLDAAAALPVTSSQASLFGPGGLGGLSLSLPFGAYAAVGIRASGGFLSDGPAPADTNRVDPGVGTWLEAGLVLLLRPLGDLEPARRATGLVLSLEAGGAWTGSLLRPAFSGAVRWGFGVDDVVLGPELRVTHVVHFDDAIDDGQAVALSLGLVVVLGDVPRVVAVPEAPPPDLDLDDDGILDEADACVAEPEDFDGLLDEDGCPETDADADGIVDPSDACPTDPEDFDGLLDEDGCPELDADDDDVLDVDDACPLEPETWNGVTDEDGCPDEGTITLVGDRVVLDDRVLFATDRSRVRHAARPILAAIVRLYLEHPEWTTLRVEGHADERGETDLNDRLSLRRAERVADVLVALGIPADRIEVASFGESRPRVEGEDEAALAQNRRVEFVMVEGPSVTSPEGETP